MEFLKVLNHENLGLPKLEIKEYKSRDTARGIVLNEKCEVALIFFQTANFHLTPGGGIDEGEDILTVLHREILEELGCTITDVKEVGKTLEYRDKLGIKQISTCYLANLKEIKQEPQYTPKEIRQKAMIKWVSIEEAINLLSTDKSDHYVWNFIKPREIAFLKKAQEILKQTQNTQTK